MARKMQLHDELSKEEREHQRQKPQPDPTSQTSSHYGEYTVLPPNPKSKIYFFYGTLMDSATLQTVLGCKERPALRPAKLSGYNVKMWGQYPALLDKGPMLTIPGMIYQTNQFDHIDNIDKRLQDYEGSNYRLRNVLVEIEGQEKELVRAITFEWAADVGELKDGNFDLRDYQMRKLDT